MAETDYYKYLGKVQARNIAHSAIKGNFLKEYTARIRKVCKTELKSRKMFKAINTLAMPILTRLMSSNGHKST